MIERREKYTRKIREKIISRDDGVSQLRKYSEEKGWYRHGGYCADPDTCNSLHVHHIKPQRTGGNSNPKNLITLGSCQHVGRCPEERILPEHQHDRGKPGKWVSEKEFVVHPDMREALMNYRPDKKFDHVFERRDKLVDKGVIYWNDIHDDEMKDTARQRSINPKFFL